MEFKKVMIRLRLKDTGVVLNAPEDIEKELVKGGFKKGFDKGEKSAITLLFATDKNNLKENIEKVIEGNEYDAIFWIIIPRSMENLDAQELHEVARELEMRPVTQVKVHPSWFAYRYRPEQRVR